MSLILCRQEPVTVPYPLEELGIHLYSSQELCYVIYHYPLLVMEGFICGRLINFIRDELRMPFLADRLTKWMENRKVSDELLFLILQDCAFYSQQEQARYRQEVTALRKLPPAEYEKRRGDYYYELHLYGKALSVYEKLLEPAHAPELTSELKGKLWNNIAACYTKLFCYQKAMHAYDCAWSEDGKEEYIKRMYFLTCRQPELTVKERYQEKMTEENKKIWEEELRENLEVAKQEKAVTDMRQVFEQDPLKRLSRATEIVNQWKLEYRKMI